MPRRHSTLRLILASLLLAMLLAPAQAAAPVKAVAGRS